MSKTTRSFIAIALNEQLHKELGELQNKLKEAGADVKWVAPENIHLTLKFLGNITDEQIKKVKNTLKKIASDIQPYQIHLKDIGAFPGLSHPRVIWAGMDEGHKECKTLAKSIEDSMEKLGFEKEKRSFSPHLTLGRVRSDKNKHQLITAIGKEKDFASQSKVSVDKIILFQSTLTPRGPIYAPLAELSTTVGHV